MTKMKASDIFIKALENHWVKTIYWVPWEENLDFVNSLKDSSIELIITRNEQTAVFMAATFGRITGKVGVALATLWPWATNMMTWVAYAQLWGMPILVITWQKPIKQSKQWFFQIIDVVSMMHPITKYSESITSIHRVLHIVNSAIKTAEKEKPWAVHIELPEDVASEEIEFSLDLINKIPYSRRPIIDDKMLQILIEKLESAKSPIILVGSWANRKKITRYLTKFIEKYNIPFFSSQMWKWVVNEWISQYLGTAALTENDYIHNALEKSDLILSVGYDSIEKPTQIISEGKTDIIHINFTSTLVDLVYEPCLEVIWDIWNVFWELSETKINSTNWNFDEIYRINEENKKTIEENLKLEDDFEIMMPRKLSKDLREVLKNDDILALDNWLYKVWLARNYPAYEPNTILLDNALATMWAWFSSAMEAKRLNPDKNVICVTGDWWLVMNLGDLETAIRLKLDLVIVVLNNSNYWMIKWKQKWALFEDFWLDFWNPNFTKLIESFGGTGFKVENKNDFKDTLKKAINTKWLVLIDLDFSYPDEIN